MIKQKIHPSKQALEIWARDRAGRDVIRLDPNNIPLGGERDRIYANICCVMLYISGYQPALKDLHKNEEYLLRGQKYIYFFIIGCWR